MLVFEHADCHTCMLHAVGLFYVLCIVIGMQLSCPHRMVRGSFSDHRGLALAMESIDDFFVKSQFSTTIHKITHIIVVTYCALDE